MSGVPWILAMSDVSNTCQDQIPRMLIKHVRLLAAFIPPWDLSTVLSIILPSPENVPGLQASP